MTLPEESSTNALFDEMRLCAGASFWYPDSLLFQPDKKFITDDLEKAMEFAQAALKTSHARATRKEIFEGVPKHYKSLLAVRRHEYDHLRRHVGTTYGILCHALRSNSSLLVARLFDLKMKIGLLAADEVKALNKSLDGEGIPTAEQCLQAGYLGNEQMLAAMFKATSWSEFILGASRFADLASVEARVEDFEPPAMFEGECTASIGIRVQGNVRTISVVTILELFAIAQQANALLAQGEPLDEIESYLKDPQHEYSLALLCFWTYVGRPELPEVGDQEISDDEADFNYFRLHPFELWCLAELALWLPFHPSGFSLENRRVLWRDVNPGMRFVQILQAFKEMDLPLTPIPATSEEKNRRWHELQEKVCRHFGWPTPIELASEWLESLNVSDRASRNPLGAFLDTSNEFWAKNVRAALQLAIQRPAEFNLGGITPSASLSASSPGWIIPSKGQETNTSIASCLADLNQEEACWWFSITKTTRLLAEGPRFQNNLRRFDEQSRRILFSNYLAYFRDQDGSESELLAQTLCKCLLLQRIV